MSPVEALPRGAAPFDGSGIERDAAGVARYTGLAPSLVALLRAAVDANPDGEALVEIGGRRLTYRQFLPHEWAVEHADSIGPRT